METPADALGRAISRLTLDEPFYGHLFSSLIREITSATPTMGVGIRDGRLLLRVNPRFLRSLSHTTSLRSHRSERIAVVKHEALHLVFRHIFRQEDHRHPMLYNIAADLVVNQLVKPWSLPDAAITLATFPDLALPENASVEWYYRRLLALGEDAQLAPQSAEVLAGLAGGALGEHSLWGEGQDLDTQLAEVGLDRLIAQARDRAGARGWGLLPGAVQLQITAAHRRRRPSLSWRRVVRIFAASSRKTRLASTLRRRSKRYGTWPGLQVKRLHKLAVVVDTSGSVSDRELSLFFSEIHGIWRQGTDITVVECDAAVQRTWRYQGRAPAAIGGRGGTLFDPALAWLSHDRMVRFDGCIYLTDGRAPAPTVRPPCRLLWVVTADGDLGAHLLHGRTIRLPSD